jgi:hypothetical protein
MVSIPEELLEQVERNNVVLLIGDGINRGALPSLAEIARQLALRCDYPADEPQTLPRVAAYYLLTNGDRHSLVNFLRDRLDSPGLKPSASHRLLVKLRPRVVVTTCYDRLLERAVQEAALHYTPVIANEEVAYSDELQMMLVWLWGTLDRPDSLIVTEDDHRYFLANRKSLSYVLRAELARRTWLFLGFAAQDEWFLNFYDGVVRDLDRHHRRAYIVGTELNAYARAWWSARAQILDVEVEPFLAELVSRVTVAGRDKPEERWLTETAESVSVPVPARPYKRLDFYESTDAPIFFGRDSEIQALSSLIHGHRLVLFYGPSGAGKTSLLLAGVMPRLEQAETGYQTFYVRALADPAAAIRQAVCRRFGGVDLPQDGSLVDFLDAAARETNSSLVIILDQFEEFFIRFNPQVRQAFVAELGALYDARDVPVKVVLALREDWLASVNELRERIPEVFYVDLRLLPLTREQARQAITGPAGRMGMRYDSDLAPRLLNDLAEDAASSESDFVMPPQLQLVCDALYDHARAEGRRYMTLADYESVGGAHGILDRFVAKALDEHRGDEREVAKSMLMALVTSHGTRDSRNPEGLATELGLAVTTLEPVLSRLTGQRLVRRLDEGNMYELAHDILAATIAGWIGEENRQLKQTRELLNRELADWRHDRSTLLSQSKFRRINAARDLLHFSAEEASFLLRGAVLYDEAVPYWLEKVSDPNTRCRVLLEMLAGDLEQARLNAAWYLVLFPSEHTAATLAQTALGDHDLAVRRMAAAGLSRMGTAVRSALPLLFDALDDSESRQQAAARYTLAIIADDAPELLKRAGRPIPIPIYRELAQLRLRREWPWIRTITAAGAGAGALGTGLGLGIPFALHASTILYSFSLLDLVFILPLLAIFGTLVGAIMALGIGAGEGLLRERSGLGRIAGGAILGGLGFAVVFSPLVIADDAFTNRLLGIAGASLLGVLIALGIMLPRAISSSRLATLAGGALGASLGMIAWGALGNNYLKTESVPLAILFACGTFYGLIMALAIIVAEARRPLAEKDYVFPNVTIK